MALEIGQVIWLRIRFNNAGSISQSRHPYLIIARDEEYNTLELGQIDSLEGKEYKAAFRCNKTILSSNPDETVIYKDSFIQMDNKFLVEDYPELERFRKTLDKLSSPKFEETVAAYTDYQNSHHISENKTVYMTKTEIEELNT